MDCSILIHVCLWTISLSLLKLMSIDPVMPWHHLLCGVPQFAKAFTLPVIYLHYLQDFLFCYKLPHYGEQYCCPEVWFDKKHTLCENLRSTIPWFSVCTCTCGLQVTGSLSFGERAHNLDVREEDHPSGTFKLGSGSPEAVCAVEGDLRLDCLQHHHVGVHVGDADTHIFSKAPGETAVIAEIIYHPIWTRIPSTTSGLQWDILTAWEPLMMSAFKIKVTSLAQVLKNLPAVQET